MFVSCLTASPSVGSRLRDMFAMKISCSHVTVLKLIFPQDLAQEREKNCLKHNETNDRMLSVGRDIQRPSSPAMNRDMHN